MDIEIKRFKTKEGREGTYAHMGNGFIKLLYDDGDMAMLIDPDFKREDSSEAGRNTRHPQMEPSYPLVVVGDIPSIIEKLSHGAGDPRYAVLMFIPKDSADREYVNLQYSMENGVVGLDWVLLGGRNIEDAEAIKAFAASCGHELKHREMNEVEFLRTEGPGIAELGMSVVTEFYHFLPTTKIKLLVEGFNWMALPVDPI